MEQHDTPDPMHRSPAPFGAAKQQPDKVHAPLYNSLRRQGFVSLIAAPAAARPASTPAVPQLIPGQHQD